MSDESERLGLRGTLDLIATAAFVISYLELLLATTEVDQSLGSSTARAEWENIFGAEPQKTAAEYAKSARRAFLTAILFGGLSALCFVGGLGWVMLVVLYL